MKPLIQEIWRVIASIWCIGDAWLHRIAVLAVVVLLAMFAAAMLVPQDLQVTVVPILALIPLAGLLFLAIKRPTLVAIAATAEIGRKAIRAVSLALAADLIFGIYLSLVPISNDRGLVPLLVLVLVTIVLLRIGNAPAFISVLMIILAVAISVVFFIGGRDQFRPGMTYQDVCVVTPEGLRSYVNLKRDPIYGLSTHPCTTQEIIDLRREKVSVPESQSISVTDARNYPFFDSVTGQPKVWYSKRTDGSYALFDRPGSDPATGESLKPIDEVVRQDLIRRQQSADQQHAQEEVQAAQRAQDAAAADLINVGIHRQSGVRQAAILIFSRDASSVTTVESEVAEALKQRGVSPVLLFFKPAFLQHDRAERLFHGDWSAADGLNLAAHVNFVVIGSAASTFSSSSNLDNVMSAHTQIELQCFDTATHSSCGQSEINSDGAGFSQQEALGNSYSRAASQIVAFSRRILLN
jgi:hypothetical protein